MVSSKNSSFSVGLSLLGSASFQARVVVGQPKYVTIYTTTTKLIKLKKKLLYRIVVSQIIVKFFPQTVFSF